MATKRQLTHKEIMMINDLLDGQLSPEKAKLAFLAIERDQPLAIAYEKLSWTKSLLRQAPRRKVPHNFTLTRQMAKEATVFSRLRRQTFSIAGALASFLFVVLLAIQLVPMGFKAAMPALDMANEVAMMEEAAAPEMMQAVEEAPVEEEAMLMEAEMPEAAMAEPLAEEVAADSMPTASVEDAVGGGAQADEEPIEEEVFVEGMDSEEEQQLLGEEEAERLPEQYAEEAPLAPDDALTKEIIPETSREENIPVQKQQQDWLFLATVLTGLLAFVFIFISLRNRYHQ